MTILQSILLGIIQGLTEFLPISSSAHLVLIPYLLNWNIPQSQVFPFDVLVQLGTLAAVILFFWKDLWLIIREFVSGILKGKPFGTFEARLGWYLILATIPAGIAGLLLKSSVEAAFNSARVTALFLLVTAAFLLIAEWVGKRQKNLSKITWVDALWIGLFQAVSIFPGISRSGSTMTGGMTRQLDRPSAARFSFLMSIPIMLAAGALSVKDLVKVPDLNAFLPVMIIGFVTAGVIGYFSIRWLLAFIQKRSFIPFAIYCAAMASLVLAVSAFRAPTAALAQASTSTQPVAADSTSVVSVAFTPSMSILGSSLSECADQQAGFNMVVQEVPTSSLDAASADVILRLGIPASLSLPSYTLGNAPLVFIVNSSNPLKELNLDQLQQVLSARMTSWDALQQSCPDCFSGTLPDEVKNAPVALNFYGADEDIQQAMENAAMRGILPARSQALLVPDPAAMILSIKNSPTAIGFVPTTAGLTGVNPITITDLETTALSLPVLAITQTRAEGSIQSWLACVQDSLKP